MQHLECVVEVVGGARSWDGEVISERVNDDDDGLVEGLRVPASCRVRRHVREGWIVALGFVIEDEAGEEETFGEEVDAESVEEAAASSASGRSISVGRKGKHT